MGERAATGGALLVLNQRADGSEKAKQKARKR
jgi:hypothetical protein